jgi:NAD(P)-dependent dehydrogenase (short-subunit alcohol dehydrogenase family)
MSGSLKGKTALVTGATSGIGRAVADVLARRGAHVIISGRSVERGQRAVMEIRAAGGSGDFVPADLTDPSAVRELAAAAREVTGRINILVNNAGIYPFAGTSDTTEELFDQVYDVNVKAPLFLTAALAPHMADEGEGAIINVSTGAASMGLVGVTAYASSKAALNELTRIWAAEYGPSGVRANAVVSGVVVTEGVEAVPEAVMPALVARTPVGRAGQPGEIAEAVAYLASDVASFVNGALLAVDGGYLVT